MRNRARPASSIRARMRSPQRSVYPPPGVLPRAQPHVAAAEKAILRGELPSALSSLSAALDATGGTLAPNDDELLSLYKRMLRLSRRECAADAAPALLDHLRTVAARAPDASTVHLVVADAVYRGHRQGALALLSELRAEAVTLSRGSFDLLIQAAARERDRRAAIAAYWLLRRSGLRPSAQTLNGLMKAERRAGRPAAALSLLRRAEMGAPRWPGGRPDVWSWTAGMSAAFDCGDHEEVYRIFSRMRGDRRLEPNLVSYNVAMHSRLKLRDVPGALRIYRTMLDPTSAAPQPDITSFNTLMGSLASAGESFTWVLRDMSDVGVYPDAWTVCTLLRTQRDLRGSLRVWRWGQRRGIRSTRQVWHHVIEAHVRHGRPARAAPLLALMARDGIAPDDVGSHNLFLRSLVSSDRPADALTHFERMCAEHGPPAGGEAAPAERGGGEAGSSGASLARWPSPLPRPDAHSCSIALTALRLIAEAEMPLGRASREERRAHAGRALRVVLGDGDGAARVAYTPELVHSLLTACGADTRSAISLWQQEVRPRLQRGELGVGGADGRGSRAELAALCGLMRVCGSAGKADEALRIVYGFRRDGIEADGRAFMAFENAKRGGGGGAKSTSGLLNAGYEKLLMMECCPEREAPRPFGNLEKIRIQLVDPRSPESDGGANRTMPGT